MLKNDSSAFDDLSLDELYGIEGGLFGVDDIVLATLFAAGFTMGAATGIARRARTSQTCTCGCGGVR